MTNSKKIVTEENLRYFKEKLNLSIQAQIAYSAPKLSENGTWIIDGIDTGLSARNEAITTPQIQSLFE